MDFRINDRIARESNPAKVGLVRGVLRPRNGYVEAYKVVFADGSNAYWTASNLIAIPKGVEDKEMDEREKLIRAFLDHMNDRFGARLIQLDQFGHLDGLYDSAWFDEYGEIGKFLAGHDAQQSSASSAPERDVET